MANIAFLGLGVMGFPMAGHLKKAGHSVTVYNRTSSKAELWTETHGGASAPTPQEAAKNADYVISCVGNDDDLRSVVIGDQGALSGMGAGTIFIDHTTVSAKVTEELYQQLSAQSISFIDAPISGGQAGAEEACSPSCAVAILTPLKKRYRSWRSIQKSAKGWGILARDKKQKCAIKLQLQVGTGVIRGVAFRPKSWP